MEEERRDIGGLIEKHSVRASTDRQVALISLGADCAVGVVGRGSDEAQLLLNSWIYT